MLQYCCCCLRVLLLLRADLGQRECVAQVQQAVHVGVWEVAKELALRTSLACRTQQQQQQQQQ
jgi:hypothetical protein